MKYIELSSKDNLIYKNAIKVKNLKLKNELLVDGIKLIQEAVQNGYLLLDLFVYDKSWLLQNENFIYFLKKNNPNLKVYLLKKEMFNDLSYNLHPNQVIGWFKKVSVTNINLDYKKGLSIFLDNLQDPGNVGTIIRTAQALGAKNIFLYNCVNLNNNKLVKAAMGASFYDNVIPITNLEEFLKNIKAKQMRMVTATLNAEAKIMSEILWSDFEKIMLVVGNEGHGVSETLKNACDYQIKIPMKNHMESLNVAVASGIIMYYLLSFLA